MLVGLLLLTSCSNCFWHYQEIKTDCSFYNSQSIHYCPRETFNNIDLEFLKGEYGVLCYLGVYNCSIPPAECNEKTSEVIIGIDGEGTRYYALRMEGDQRLLLPNDATDKLLCAFGAGKDVIIALDGYYAEICGCEFPSFK